MRVVQPNARKGGKSRKRDSASAARERQALAQRRLRVSRLNLDGWTQQEIAADLGVDPAQVCRDLKALRLEWAAEHKAATHEHVERELVSLQRDEKDVRERLEAVSGEHPDRDAAKWHDVLLKIRDRRSKLLGLDAPTKLETKTEARVAFTDDVTKILADPEATTRLLDAVQGQTVVLPPADASRAPGA